MALAMLAELTAVALACAPNVAPATLTALVRHESRANPYAIGVNRGAHLARQPQNLDDAVRTAKNLIKQGANFDAGLAQINVHNWQWLGLTAENVFDPCTNLGAAQTILADCYRRALADKQGQQRALRAALSCYNTGNFRHGFTNGYVAHVLASAGVKVPGIKPTNDPSESAPASPKPSPRPVQGTPDGFTAKPTPDGFMRPRTPEAKQTPSQATAS